MIETVVTYLFFALPVFALVWFVVSLVRYNTARRRNKRGEEPLTDEAKMKRLRIQLIISSVLLGVVVLFLLVLAALLFLAIAFM